ncbi:restriction endonuclease subunit S [Photobacterium leiognathi]|uniref:Restriction endonuclease subunit S n=1 Tax=Photobacterium leiognathi TaxID=553611 RepID=A0ABX5GEW7_PHOLE|nr:restriction endonuclease subunit S [Photobacterium leiognathi]KJF90423.1 hypothetical protein UB42_08485 [Photobacterium leiognathi]PSV81429.1 restriction endonuclease subunit S [Photobacterium leiognathi]
MNTYHSYETYKESSIEWSDVLPTHWESVSLRWISTIYAGGTPSKTNLSFWENGTVPWLNSGSVNQRLIIKPSTYITDQAYKNSSAKWIPKDSLVVALAGQGKTKGMVAQLGIDSTCNQSMAAIVPNQLEYARYLFWWLKSNYQNIRNMAGGDLRDGLNLEHLGSIQCPLPRIQESISIAAFLDHETAKIDTLIEKQQQLIELLKEKRQAVISNAVTKGLNPDAPMKDSGVEWLGEVPEHWGVSRLGFHATKIGSGKTPKGGAEIYQDSGVLFLRSQNVYDDGLRIAKSESVYINESIHHEMAGTSVQDGDVLLNITGGSIGRSCLVPTNFPDANVNQHVCILRLPTSIREFISFVMKSNSIKEQIDAFQTGGNREGLNFEQIAKLKFTLPPLNEINSIIEHIKSITVTFNTLEEQAQQAIQLMQERRTALISAAVTGKIDVRHWVAPTTSSNTTEVQQEVSV